jgi:hypothetical protein
MNIETIEIAGFAAAFSALRLPFGKEVRSRIITSIRTDNGWIWGGDEIPPIIDYPARVVIDHKDLELMNTLVKRGTEHAKVTRGIMVWAKITAPIYWWCEMETYVVGHQRLSSESTMHVDCRGLSGDDLVAAKAAIPMGKELTKVDAFSYQALRNIAKQRWNHRLPEWHVFVDWIKTLPFSQELILDGLDIYKKED